jgi:photosystem II stability/assembly factor-like uncharacterized protein
LALALVVVPNALPSAAATPKRQAPPPIVALGQPAPTSMYTATGVACGNVTDCWAVGFGNAATAAIDATTNGGGTWSAQTVPSSVSVLAAISCLDKLDCVAVGSAGAAGAVVATTDGGAIWTLGQDPVGAAAVTDVDCTSKRDCVALATDGTTYWSSVTTDGGTTWVRGGNLPAGMTAPGGLTCSSAVLCLVAGYVPSGPGQGAGAIATTLDGGETWTAVTLPAGVGILRGLSCAAATCLAVGTSSSATTGFVPGPGQLLTSTDGGNTWQVVEGPVVHDDAFAASCPDPKTCVVVGTDWLGSTQPIPTGSIVTTLDAGVQWRSADHRYVPVAMASVACPAVNRCVAAGGNVLVHLSLPVTTAAPKPKVSPGSRAPVR